MIESSQRFGKIRELAYQLLEEQAPRDVSAQQAPTIEGYSPLYRSAAVLAHFDPSSLMAEERESSREERQKLLASSELVHDVEDRPVWRLQPEVRRKVLRELGGESAWREVLSRQKLAGESSLQRTLRIYLLGDGPALEEQDRSQLADTIQVSSWLAGVVPGVPTRSEIESRMDFLGLLEPFEELVAHFKGREKQIQDLRDYVGVLPPGSLTEFVTRAVRQIFRLREKPPLVIHGPGGRGKSTLMAQFIIEHAVLDKNQKFPFTYINFDRPGLLAHEPVTLLADGLRQLGAQYPEHRATANRLRREWQQQLGSLIRRSRQQLSRSASSAFLESRVEDHSRCVNDFRGLLRRMEVWERPYLLVLDTFEEVQYRGPKVVNSLWEFLEQLQRAIPTLRTVLAGRSEVEQSGLAVENVELPNLDPEAAAGFLQAQGIDAPKLAARLAKQLGGSPLTLRLAAELIRRDEKRAEFDQEGIRDLETRGFWRRLGFRVALEQERIQGELFKRILSHIHDKRVRDLAHPGMVLRRVNPRILLEVLAVPCKVPLADLDAAREVFAELRRETSLVSPSKQGDLVYRPELRRLMIELIERDEKEGPVTDGEKDEEKGLVAQIDRAAVDFYRKQAPDDDALRDEGGIVARAEEIYHQLRLHQEPEIVEPLWPDDPNLLLDVREQLFGAQEELRPTEAAYLADRLDLPVSKELRAAARVESWERHAARTASERLESGSIDDALEVLAERSERSAGSLLYYLEADALHRSGRYAKARKVIEAGIESFAEGDSVDRLPDFLQLSADIEADLGDPERAERRLENAARTLCGRRTSEGRVKALMLRLRQLELLRESGAEAAKLTAVRTKLREDAAQLSPEEREANDRSFIRAAAEAAGSDLELLSEAVRLGGLEVATPRQLRALAWVLKQLDREGFPAGNSGWLTSRLELDGSPEKFWDVLLETSSRSRTTSLLVRALDAVDEMAPDATGRRTLLETIANVLRQGSGPRTDEEEFGPWAGLSYRPARLDLPPEDVEELTALLTAAFPSREELEAMVSYRFSRSLSSVALSEEPAAATADLVQTARSEDALAGLIVAARESRPADLGLLRLAARHGLAPAAALDATSATWLGLLGTTEGKVCRVKIGKNPRCTGFLVGPDLILTSSDAVKSDPGSLVEDVAIVFDEWRLGGKVVRTGTRFGLRDPDWRAVVNLEYKFALLHLDGAPGSEPVGGERAEPDAPKRGWIEAPADAVTYAAPPAPLAALFYRGNKNLEVLVDDAGARDAESGGEYLRYSAVPTGDSFGAPIFNANWVWTALHQSTVSASRGSSRRKEKLGQGIAVSWLLDPEKEGNLAEWLGSAAPPTRRWSADDFDRNLARALDSFDPIATEELCEQLLRQIRGRSEPYPERHAKRILAQLRRKRRFDLMQRVADAFIQHGQDAPTINRQYAQALLDRSAYTAAIAVLERLVEATGKGDGEHEEAKGLLGRAFKQLYVDAAQSFAPAHADHLRKAIDCYAEVYFRDPKKHHWHGINVVALLKRAERDDVSVTADLDGSAIAASILEDITRQDLDFGAALWDFATAVEACLALEHHDEALEWLSKYLQSTYTDAFELASTYRQFTEIWQLDAGTPPGDKILPALKSALLRQEGGEVEVSAEEAGREKLSDLTGDPGVEKVFGYNTYLSLKWFETCMQRARAVGRVEDMMEAAVGTCFLVKAGDLGLEPSGEVLVLTNAHIVSDDESISLALGLQQVRLRFELGGEKLAQLAVSEVVWSSPPDELDATLLRVAGGVDWASDLEPMPIAERLPRLDGKQRAYIIGHPQGRRLSFSIHDTHLLDADDRVLHYRSPTSEGSSGSPVFDRNWQLIGLHHAGLQQMPRLAGKTGVYPANEGIQIQAIKAGLLERVPAA